MGFLLVAAVFLFGTGYFARFEAYRRAANLRPFTHEAGPVRTVQVPMRDGVKLNTRVHLPAGDGPFPTVFMRNPYELLVPLERLHCGLLVRYGYACVLQDVRGQMASEGTWWPILHEREDGLDALQWLVAQPFVDGNVAMRGPSYLTCTQWAVAGELPPQVKTLVPQVFGTDLRLALYERGLLRTDVLTAWATLMPERGMRSMSGADYRAAASHRPALEADTHFMTKRLDWYRDTLRAASPSAPYWFTEAMTAFREAPARAKVPMLFLGGFFDPFFAAQVDSFERLATKDQSVFILGPWNHLNMTSGDFPMPPDTGRLDTWVPVLEWLDHHLRGAPLVTLQPGTVRVLAPGDDTWRTRPAWPAPGGEPRRWVLGAGERAQACEGGTLTEQAPAPSKASYVFDPKNPAPTRGGASLLSFAFYRREGTDPGPVDQGDSCARDDVLTFKAAPLEGPARLSGAARLTLPVRSTAPDTSFVARLVLEQDGKAFLVREASATLAYPTAAAQEPQPYVPGERAVLVFDFWPIEWLFDAGARLRLDVTSSSFPALAVHSNRAGKWEEQTGTDVATQTLELDGEAVLEVPLAPEAVAAVR